MILFATKIASKIFCSVKRDIWCLSCSPLPNLYHPHILFPPVYGGEGQIPISLCGCGDVALLLSNPGHGSNRHHQLGNKGGASSDANSSSRRRSLLVPCPQHRRQRRRLLRLLNSLQAILPPHPRPGLRTGNQRHLSRRVSRNQRVNREDEESFTRNGRNWVKG